MTIIKWEPFGDIDRFWGDHSPFLFPQFSKLGFDLAVDVFEEKGNIVAKMSLPGIKPDEVDISLEGDELTISGRREEEKEIDKKDYYSKEIRRGSFSRTVSLPRSVNTAKSDAKYDNGVLTITMPIIAGAKEKSVKIKMKK